MLEDQASRKPVGPVYGDEPAPASAIVYDLAYEIGEVKFSDGDFIEIRSVRGDRPNFEVGGTYEVRGRYRLRGKKEANLVLSVTSTSRNYGGSVGGPLAKMSIGSGEGDFVLTKQFSYPGLPHITFYGVESGRPIGGVYFGLGDWFRRPWGASADDGVTSDS
ncbi:MAG: hypothetical protein WD226_02175 [Planctomycetota bacterium]